MKKLSITALSIRSFVLTDKVRGRYPKAEKDSYTGACCSIEPACPSAFVL
jgi:hypothetical protein